MRMLNSGSAEVCETSFAKPLGCQYERATMASTVFASLVVSASQHPNAVGSSRTNSTAAIS
jgi:hypothetical protein